MLLGRLHGVPTPVNARLQQMSRQMLHDAVPPRSLRPEDILRSPTSHMIRPIHCSRPGWPEAVGSPSQSGGVSQTNARIAITQRS